MLGKKYSSGIPGTSGQTPQLFHSQAVTGTTTTALPGNTPLYNTPLTPMTPITPATPASESSGIVPQLQYVEKWLFPADPQCNRNCQGQNELTDISKHIHVVMSQDFLTSKQFTACFFSIRLNVRLILSALRNIVSTVNLGCKLDLKTIALRARNAEYNPKVRPKIFQCISKHLGFF